MHFKAIVRLILIGKNIAFNIGKNTLYSICNISLPYFTSQYCAYFLLALSRILWHKRITIKVTDNTAFCSFSAVFFLSLRQEVPEWARLPETIHPDHIKACHINPDCHNYLSVRTFRHPDILTFFDRYILKN